MSRMKMRADVESARGELQSKTFCGSPEELKIKAKRLFDAQETLGSSGNSLSGYAGQANSSAMSELTDEAIQQPNANRTEAI
jgi:hypothetical protein